MRSRVCQLPPGPHSQIARDRLIGKTASSGLADRGSNPCPEAHAPVAQRQRRRFQKPFSVSSNLTRSTKGFYPNGRGIGMRGRSVRVRISGGPPSFLDRGVSRSEKLKQFDNREDTCGCDGNWHTSEAQTPGFCGFDPHHPHRTVRASRLVPGVPSTGRTVTCGRSSAGRAPV